MVDLDNVVPCGIQVEFISKGLESFKNKSYDDAISFYNQALENGRCKEAYFGLGQVFYAQGKTVKAIAKLTEAVRLDTTYHEAYSLMGRVYFAGGHGIASAENHAQSVVYNPNNDDYKQQLVNAVSAMTFKNVNPNFKGVLLECLENKNIEFKHFGNVWLNIVVSDPLIKNLYKFAKYRNYGDFKKAMKTTDNYDCLIEPFFLTGLGKFIIPSPVFERWCLFLRRFLLESISSNEYIFSDSGDMEMMICALAKYCFLTDYIFKSTDEEIKLLDKLSNKIEATATPNLAELGILGCYRKLCLLKNSKEIAANLQGGDHVSQILKSQIEDYFIQADIKKDIPVLTKIKDEVSSAVREQYEEFPYPRWDIAAKNLFNDKIEGCLKGQGIKILNAGCGTGQEAVQMAYVFPDAQITAVDLSSSSLAYAIFKARQLGISNIRFMQGDIMELGSIDERFDYIASAGVLHHMDDPKAGWKILNSLLKPEGLMRIALYSSRARWAINAARDVIKEKKIRSTAESIKDFRENISDYLKYKPIKNIENFFDYYSLSECRDLLFHVQEHQFNLPEIKNIIDEFDLEFLQLYLSDSELNKYKKRNPIDQNAIDLDSLDKYESKNPDLFNYMYTFWCQKKPIS